jgi:hypothetical protein
VARLLGQACITVAIAGCVVPPIPPSTNPNWTRVSGEEANCISYAPRRHEAVDFNIILEPDFEKALVAQLDAVDPDDPKCWYETPTGAIRLFAGEFCVGGTDAFFEQQASGWKLVKSNMVWTTCRPSGK